MTINQFQGVEEEEEEEEGGEAGAELAEEVGGTVQGVKEPEPTPVEEKKTEEPEQTRKFLTKLHFSTI